MKKPAILVNGEILALNPQKFAVGKLALVSSEQCDNCAEDIASEGALSESRSFVVCSCGEQFIIADRG